MKCDVLVAGAGLGGLTAGIALAREGFEVCVLEAGTDRRVDHWGFTIWPPGTRTFDWLGLLDGVKAEGCRIKSFRWLSGDGNEWVSVDLARLEDVGTFVGILPSRLLNVLEAGAAANGVTVLKGAADWEFKREDDGSFEVRARASGEEWLISCKLIVGSDGPQSALRQRLGINAWQWRPPGQVIVTGIGGQLEVAESRQAMGDGWSAGSVSLGHGKSWVYAILGRRDKGRGLEPFGAYEAIEPQARTALAELRDVAEIRPWSIRVRRWATDGILLIGDAAHTVLPHIGLGGTMTLEDIPILCEIASGALHNGDTSAARLSEFQRRRRRRVAYAHRVSEVWALSMTSQLPGFRLMRDFNFRRLAKNPEKVETFVRELSSPEPVRLGTRVGVLIP